MYGALSLDVLRLGEAGIIVVGHAAGLTVSDHAR